MKIIDAAQLAEYTKPISRDGNNELSRKELQSQIGDDAKLVSKKFFLTRVPLNRLASPIDIHASGGPIVVDVNQGKIGKTSNGFFPKVIVVSGQETFRGYHDDKRVTARVWVGELAAQKLDIKADHMIGSDELRRKLQDELTRREGPRRNTTGHTIEQYPYIVEVYPFENYFIYTKHASQFRQLYELDENDNVNFSGRPIEVEQVYVQKTGGTRFEASVELHACGCGTVKAEGMDRSCAMKAGKTVTYAQALKAYSMAVSRGYKPTLKAKAPPGWSGTVRQMKEHEEIDNPFALAYWMEEQGYEPHKGED